MQNKEIKRIPNYSDGLKQQKIGYNKASIYRFDGFQMHNLVHAMDSIK